MDDYERVLLVKPDVHVFRIPPRTTNRAYRASEWNLDSPDWNCRLRLIARGNSVFIRLEERSTGQFFGQCPIERYPGTSIETVSDSSRYFVLRLVNDDTKRTAFVGIGFVDRSDSFDLNVALQDHFKIVQMEQKADEKASKDDGPKLDLGFKEGQTIKVNLNIGKKAPTAKARPKASGGITGILLPPPPSGKTLSSTSVGTGNSNSDDSSSASELSSSTNNVSSNSSSALHQQLLDGLEGLSMSEPKSVPVSGGPKSTGTTVPLTPANSLCLESTLLEFSPPTKEEVAPISGGSSQPEKDLWFDFESFDSKTSSKTFDDWAKF